MLPLFINATRELCFFCFEILVNQLLHESSHLVQSHRESRSFPDGRFPLFVTETKDGALRDYIGTFASQPLFAGLREYTLRSDLEGRRFTPIESSELPFLECKVSLLHSFETWKDRHDWERGTHRIIFRLSGHSVTFFPKFPGEQQETKGRTLQQIAQKAGLKQKLTQVDLEKVELQRYQSSCIG
jgi:uncharacterized protein (TIGR00296 family)